MNSWQDCRGRKNTYYFIILFFSVITVLHRATSRWRQTDTRKRTLDNVSELKTHWVIFRTNKKYHGLSSVSPPVWREEMWTSLFCFHSLWRLKTKNSFNSLSLSDSLITQRRMLLLFILLLSCVRVCFSRPARQTESPSIHPSLLQADCSRAGCEAWAGQRGGFWVGAPVATEQEKKRICRLSTSSDPVSPPPSCSFYIHCCHPLKALTSHVSSSKRGPFTQAVNQERG